MASLTTATRLAVTSPSTFIRAVRYRHGAPRYRTLRRLVEQAAPATILEIGVWQGSTSRLMIEAAAGQSSDIRFWGLDLFAAGMTEEALIREASLRPLAVEEVGRRLSDLPAQVELVAGDSTSTLPTLDLPPIDFAFIDGGHSYETVAADWTNVQRVLAPDAIVVFDDYTNAAAVEHEGYGVRRLVDELDSDWHVRLLRPVDRFARDYGSLTTRLALVRRRSVS